MPLRVLFTLAVVVCYLSAKTSAFEKKAAQVAEQAHRLEAEDRKFLQKFERLAPAARVETWKHATDLLKRNKPQGRTLATQEVILMARGTDAIDFFVEIVRSGGKDRVRALILLCNMDRFVPRSAFAVPEAVAYQHSPTGIAGSINPFSQVDGRRIGERGLAAVHGAATQTRDPELRLYARYYGGFLRQECDGKPPDAIFVEWRKTVAAARGPYYALGLSERAAQARLLRDLVVAHFATLIPQITATIERDQNGAVVEEAILIAEMGDRATVRLRASEAGRALIVAIQAALRRNDLRPVLRTAESRHRRWEDLERQFYRDEFFTDVGSVVRLISLAFNRLYGENTKPEDLSPKFISFLTRVDPSFPSWEFPSTNSHLDVLNPLFRKKMDRYYLHWKDFVASQAKPSGWIDRHEGPGRGWPGHPVTADLYHRGVSHPFVFGGERGSEATVNSATNAGRDRAGIVIAFTS